jgi:hypothetical protein
MWGSFGLIDGFCQNIHSLGIIGKNDGLQSAQKKASER